jgi:hypothetical protein
MLTHLSFKKIIGLLFVCLVHRGFSQIPFSQVQQAETYLTRYPVKSKFNYLILKFFSNHNQILTSGFLEQLDAQTQFAGYTDEEYADQYFKLVNPDLHIDTSLIFKEHGLHAWMLWTLYTDQLPPDSRYFKLADSLIQAKNSRDLTHLGIFLGFLNHKNTHLSSPDMFRLKKRTMLALRKIFVSQQTQQDTWMEAVIALQLMKKSPILTPALLKKTLHHQQDDGGWSYTLEPGDVSNEHTTILALWLLNNYFYYQHD